MDKGAELFGWDLSGKNGDPASVAHAKRRCDALFELKLDTLRDQKVEGAFPVLAYFAVHPLREIGERCALGLAHILSRDLRPGFYPPMRRAILYPLNGSQGR